jgi:hypothetical protein
MGRGGITSYLATRSVAGGLLTDIPIAGLVSAAPGNPTSVQQIVQEFACWLDVSHQQIIARARHVEQVPFAVVDLF